MCFARMSIPGRSPQPYKGAQQSVITAFLNLEPMTPGKTHKNVHSRKYWLGFAAAFLTCFCARAFIVGPYTADTNTVHLWHLDETAVLVLDSAYGGTNLTAIHGSASLGNASITGFGNCLSTAGSGQSYLAPLVWTGNTAGDGRVVFFANENSGLTYSTDII